MKKILVIGGTGLLSGAVVREALKQGCDVTCINRGTRTPMKGSHAIISDKDNYQLLKKELKGKRFDAVIDFLVRKTDELQLSFDFYSQYTQQYVFVSSTMVYNSSIDMIFSEDAPKVQPLWSYSKEKWDCEELLVRLSKVSNCHYTVVRPGITYDDTRLPYGIMPPYGKHWSLVARMKAGKPIVTVNSGSNKCNMMRAEDFAVGVVGLFGNTQAYDEAFNVCGNECPTYRQVLDTIASSLGIEYQTIDVTAQEFAELVPSRKEEILGRSCNYECSNRKISDLVPKFSQQISLKEGIPSVLQAYITSNYQQGIDYAWDAECDKVAIKKGVKSIHFCDYLKNATIDDMIVYYKLTNNKLLELLYKAIRKIRKRNPTSK